MRNLNAEQNKLDQELNIIIQLIKEAYKKDTDVMPLIQTSDDKICYLLLDHWCKSDDDKIILLKIIIKILDMFPDRIRDVTDLLLCRTSLIDSESEEINALYFKLYNLSRKRLH